jgi:hypothetical protein
MRKLYFLVTTLLVVALCSNAQISLHYWDFNSGSGASGSAKWPSTIAPTQTVSAGALTHNFTKTENFGGSILDAAGFSTSTAGASFCPVDQANNNNYFILNVPTTGFSDIKLTYATRGTSLGYSTHTVDYSINGNTFTNLTTITGRTSGTFSLQTVDFSSIAAANNNSDFKIRVTVSGASDVQGNNRFDNIRVTGNGSVSKSVSVAAGTNSTEAGANGTFTLSLSAPAPTGGVTVQYTLSGTATAGTDYSNPQTGSITIPAGSSIGTLTLNTLDDTEYEGNEKITITLNSATGGYLLAGSTASIDLLDNDNPPLATVVINQVYGGGGNNGSLYTNDFIELYNYGSTPLSLNGWSVQYASASGSSWQVTPLSGIIPAHGFYLIQQAAEGGGSKALPKPDATGEIKLAAGSGKMVLSTSIEALTGTSPTGPNVVDKIGYGTANSYEGAAAAPALSSTTAAKRATDGVDSDNNSADFIVSAPLPRNTTYTTTPPIVTSVTPPSGHIDAPVSIIPTILFDKPVRKGTGSVTILENNVTLAVLDLTSTSVMLTDDFTAILNTTLAPGKNYTIQIAPGAFEDLYGNDFSGINGDNWTFTTYDPATVVTTPASFTFQNCSAPGLLSSGFTQYSVTGTQVWDCAPFGRAGATPYAVQMNGYDGSNNVPNVDWLISPRVDLTGTAYPLLSFWSRRAFSGKSLQLKISTDYNGGDPALATWTDLNGKFPDETVTAWTESKDINLSLFKEANVHIAFVYTSSSEDGARWTLDDINVINSSTPPPPSLTLGSTDVQFGFTAKGATAEKTFTFVGNDLTGDVTLTASGPFLLSKDGSSYTPSISYNVADANNVAQAVWVQFAPVEKNEDFSGAVTVSTSGLTRTVTLKGTSINPAYTLEVVNWNVEWFGSPLNGPSNDDQQAANVLKVFQSLNADIYALGEIVSEERLASVVNSMPGYAYVISNYGSHTNTSKTNPSPLAEAQKLAFVYKTSVIKNLGTKALLSVGINSAADLTNPYYEDWASGRFPFLMDAEVTLNCVTKNVKFVMVHAKANTNPVTGSYDRRKDGADALHTLLNTEYANDHIVLLGDFNDDLDKTITAGKDGTSWSAFTNDAINYTALTLALSEAGKKSTVSHNDVIDHVVVSSEMDTYYMTATANIVTDVTSLVSNYGNTTSDHYPVFTRYRFEEPAIQVTIPDAYALPQGTEANTVYIGYNPASSITLTAETSDGTPAYTYNWEGGSTGASLTVSPTTPTEYTVTVTDANGCAATASKTVEVMDVRAGRNGDKVLVCHKYPRKNASLEVGSEGVADHLAHGDQLGGCGMDASVTQKAESAEPGLQLVLEAMPNPSAGVFTVSFRGGSQAAKAQLVVTDMLGRVVETRNNLQTNATYTLGSDYRNGVYLVSVLHDGERYTLKLVKQ